ncbi:MAG: hypothetical protein K2X81_00295 [Candidatus Obscuribacterales bacterium]|nr:hypothetical protein [Candidatus Obscuribacterales bacterium]
MGVSLYVSLEKTVEGIDGSVIDGKFLAKHQDRLDAICEKAGAKTIGSFISYDPADFEDMLPVSDEIKARDKEQWFDAQEGLDVLAILYAYFAEHPVEFDKRLEDDLSAVKEVLTECVKKGVRFHFAIDF